MPIANCKDRRTERFLAGERVREFQSHADAVARALTKLQAAQVLGDLRSPPSNRFEALRGDRKDLYSIRINAQYRLCFAWVPREAAARGTDILKIPGDAHDVEITDYH